MPQPDLVPGSPIPTSRTQSRRISPGTSTVWVLPLMMSCTAILARKEETPSGRFLEDSREHLVTPRRRVRPEAALVDAEGFDLRLERRGRHPEPDRRAKGPGHPALGCFQGGLDDRALVLQEG